MYQSSYPAGFGDAHPFELVRDQGQLIGIKFQDSRFTIGDPVVTNELAPLLYQHLPGRIVGFNEGEMRFGGSAPVLRIQVPSYSVPVSMKIREVYQV